MLHIILLILKIIGFLILGILALILLLAVLILLAPVVYSAEGSVGEKPGEGKPRPAECRIRFHWLFHLISGEAVCKNGEFRWHLRAAWKHFRSEAESSPSQQSQTPQPSYSSQSSQPARTAGEKQTDTTGQSQKNTSVQKAASTPESAPAQKTAPAQSEPQSQTAKPEPKQKQLPRSGREEKHGTSAKKKFSTFRDRLCALKDRIKYKFRRFCDKIKSLNRKKEKITAFLQNKIHQNAFFRLLKEIKRLFRFLKPDHADVHVEFGFSDPAYTGYTLAALSMIWPFFGEHADIRPDFERSVLKGTANVSGKIRAGYALIFAWNMIWDKNVRTTFRHIRRFRL